MTPRKVDFHTEWAMPDPPDDGEECSGGLQPGTVSVQAINPQTAEASELQTKERWIVTKTQTQ